MKKLFLLLLPFVMVLFICFTAETIEIVQVQNQSSNLQKNIKSITRSLCIH